MQTKLLVIGGHSIKGLDPALASVSTAYGASLYSLVYILRSRSRHTPGIDLDYFQSLHRFRIRFPTAIRVDTSNTVFSQSFIFRRLSSKLARPCSLYSEYTFPLTTFSA
ncbi:hypothetical protein CCACVL1_28304 [Corchorus capsularis]|uniref:Uncharacterized protein n=1 Tax=Corchorus capsularis TaxID=210143 RepID=A0A1R3G6Y0_COCAP|nr:hypothetical protein CCACVL1_28304 [Corchorus capsularis]